MSPATAATPIASPTASHADKAYETLRDLLITLEIRPGEPLAEDALIARLGVGRTPIREAMKRLESERLVAIYPRRGTFATDVNLADLGLISDLREVLEGHGAARAAEHATDIERRQMTALARRLTARASFAEQMRLDTEVHRTIYAAAANPFLADVLTQQHNLAMRIWNLFVTRIEAAGYVGEHRDLLGAIVAGDAKLARRRASAHVRNFEHAIRAVI